MAAGPSAGQVFTPRPENLAFTFQEVLTATVRLRSGRQSVVDAAVFRNQMREALKRADQEGRGRGYSADFVKLGIFAAVAFLDESILNLQHQAFAEWVRKPLQEELFGVHVAGEMFFENLKKLMAQSDSSELADLLEVHLLCLQLGYRGRYGITTGNDIKAIIDYLRERIKRIRGESRDLAPAWALPAEAAPLRRDVWTRRMLVVGAASLILVVLLFAGFKLTLASSASALDTSVQAPR